MKTYKSIQFKIILTEKEIEKRFKESPSGFYFFLKTKLFFYGIIFEFVKYFVLLARDPAESFNLFVNQKILGTCPYSYRDYKYFQKRIKIFSLSGAATIIIVAVFSSLITNFLFGPAWKTKAATYTWSQTNWEYLSSTSTASHSANQSGWVDYSATSTNVAASSTVMVLSQNNTWTVTDKSTGDTGFNNSGAARSNTVINGLANNASIALSTVSRTVVWTATTTWNSPAVGAGNYFPALADLDNDGDYDLMIGYSNGTSAAYENTNSNVSPVWAAKSAWDAPDVGDKAVPSFADLDNDGDYDLMIGENLGVSYGYQNTGSAASPTWTATSSWNTADVGSRASPALADLDNDGDYDLMIGRYQNSTVGYENTGSAASPTWTAKTAWNLSYSTEETHPALADLDTDGDYDLMIGEYDSAGGTGGAPLAYQNTGSAASPTWTATSSWNGADLNIYIRPTLADLDADGDYDLMIGKNTDGIGYGYQNTGTSTYNSSGTFTSHGFNTGGTVNWGTLSRTATILGGTFMGIKARSGNQSNLSDATAWASCTNITSGNALSTGGCVTNGHQYIQFQATLTTQNTRTPVLNDVTITYTNYPTSEQTLTSTAFDTSSAANMISKITWSTTTPTNTNVKFQMRSATTSADLSWHNWCGYEDTTANCNGGYYFTSTSTNTNLPSAHTLKSASTNPAVQDDRWIQYRILLYATGTSTPIVSDITITYVVNAKPEFDMTYGTRGITVNNQASDGTFTVPYKIRDTDSPQSTNGSPGPGYVNPTFEYSTNGGESWTTITGGLSVNATTSKAVDTSGGCTDNCTTYKTHTIAWTPTSTPSLSGTYTTQAQIRITIDDGEAANNSTSTTSALFTLDAKNPTVSVNPRITATSTTPTLYFSTTDDSSLQMRIGLNSDLSDNLNWVSYGNSTTTTLVTDPDTAYIQFRDVYDNRTSIYSVATPETPANFVVQDTSNIQTSEYRLFLAWQVYANSGNFASYRIYRSTDNGSTYSLLTTITDRTVNYYLDQSLTASSTYYYKVASMDTSGNGSFFSSPKQAVPNGAQDFGEGGGGNPTDPPTISSISSSGATTQSVSITWTTNKLSNSKVNYCSPAPCTNYTSSQIVNSYVTSHSVALGNLNVNTSYSFIVNSIDIYNNSATSSDGTTFTTNNGPKITNVSVIDLTENSAQINWDTNVSATNNTVIYGTASPPSGNQASSDAASTNRTVTLTGLSQATTYYFYAKSQDTDSNWGYDYNVSSGLTNYFSFTTPNDATAPTISNVVATSTTDTISIIYWATNEKATSQIEYGVATGNYTNISPLNTGLNIAHYQKLDNLNQNTTYYYRVASVDGSGNTASSTEKTFLTLDAQIARSRAGEFSGGGGVPQIIYLTEVEQREKLQKKLEELEKKTEGKEIISKEEYEAMKKALEEQIKNKDETIKGIEEREKKIQEKESILVKLERQLLGIKEGSDEKPEEIIKSLMAKFKETIGRFSGAVSLSETENIISETTETLTDLAKLIPPPVLSGEPSVEIFSNKATIRWETDKESNSIAAYANEEQYNPLKENSYTAETGNLEEMITDHIVTIEGLIPSSKYHYQLKSKGKYGEYAKSKDFEFTTKSELPDIFNPFITRIDDYSAAISWNTNIPADSVIKYTPLSGGEPKILGKPDFTLSHKIELKNLEPSTTYRLEILSRDKYSNLAKEEISSFSTTKDEVPPKISQIKTEMTVFPGKQEKVQVLIFWTTDEPSTSKVVFSEGPPKPGFPTIFTNETETEPNLEINHAIIITKWLPGTIYRFKTVSKDAFGNEGLSDEFTTITPKRRENVIDLIIDNFGKTFGWTKKLGF